MQPEETNVLLCRTYPVDCKKGENILREWKQSIVNGHVWKTQRFIMHNVEPYVVPHGQVDRWLFALNEMGNTKWTGEERNFHFLFFSPSCPRRRAIRQPKLDVPCLFWDWQREIHVRMARFHRGKTAKAHSSQAGENWPTFLFFFSILFSSPWPARWMAPTINSFAQPLQMSINSSRFFLLFSFHLIF